MDWSCIYSALNGLFDRQACMQVVRTIWETDRWFSNDKFEQTAHGCADYFRRHGLSQVELLPLQADGRTKYFDWTVAMGWTARSARLCYADGELICDYEQTPCCLAMRSPATPAGGVEGEVVIPDKEDPDREQYRGKVLLVSQPAGAWVPFAHEVGAVGILTDYIPLSPARPDRTCLYDDVPWNGVSSDPKYTAFAFHLTARQGEGMRARLARGPVRVHARVDARCHRAERYTVSAALEGTDPAAPEVLLYGHLYEPGANDNASGAGAILYLAGLLARGVREGLLPRPRNTIRFAVGHECGGSMGYLAAHRDRSLLCGFVADMIGAEEGERASTCLRYDPLSNWSFPDGALYALSRIAREQEGRELPHRHQFTYSIGTDNIIADPAFGCPTVAMVAVPALSYHSSHDSPDTVEPDTLARNAVIMGTYALGMATGDGDTCRFLADELEGRLALELGQGVHPRRERLLRELTDRAKASLKAICPTWDAPQVELYTDCPPDYVKPEHLRVPKRLVEGALNFRGERNGKVFAAAWNGAMNIPVFWIDGKRTLWQVAYLSAVEKGKCTDEELREELEFLTEYFDCMAENNYLKWN